MYYLKELTNQEFNNFTNSFPLYSIYQTSEYGFLMNTVNYDSIFLGLMDDNKILAASLILIEKESIFKYAYAPKGFLIDYNDKLLVEKFTELIKDYLNKKRVMAIKINPMIVRKFTDHTNNTVNDNPYFNKQIDFLKKLKYYHLGFNNLFEAFKPRFEAILDIDKDINELYRNINSEFKEKIKFADDSGIRIIKGNSKNIDYLYEQIKDKHHRDKKYFEEMMHLFKKRNMIDYYYSKLDTNAYLISVQKRYQNQLTICNNINNKLFENVGKDNEEIINNKITEENKLNELKKELIYATNLLKEKPEGIIVSTILLIKYREQIYLYTDGSNKEFKNLYPKHLMLWKLIEKYNKEGYKTFNMGGITNPSVDNEKYNNLNEFKLNFNSRSVEYIGDLELITNNTLYTLYRNSKPFRYILKKDK